MNAPLLLDRIAEVRHRSRRVDLTIASLRCAVALVAVLAGYFLLDWWVVSDFESTTVDRVGRLVLLALSLGAMGLCVRRTWWRAWRRSEHDDAVAMRIERGEPAVRGRLVATLQLTRARPSGASKDLIAALAEETVEVADGIRFTDIVDLALLKAAGIAVVTLLVAGLFSAWKPAHVAALLKRFALLDAAYPTATRLLELTPGAKVPRGEAFEVELAVDADGAVPEDGMLEVAPTGAGPSTRLALRKVGEPEDGRVRYRATIARVLEDVRFRALAGDARWPAWETLTVLERPAVRELALTAKPPAYLGEPETTSTVGDVRAVIGTVVRIHATLNKPVTEAGVRVRLGEDVETTPMTVAADGLSADLALTVRASGVWRITLLDGDGLTDTDPIDHVIVALKDRSPSVRIVSPAQDKTVTDIARPKITFAARDDHAIARAALRWRTERVDDSAEGGDPEDADATASTAPLDVPPGKREIQAETTLDLRALGVSPGTRMTWWVEAADACDPPNVANSAKYRFTVVDVRTMQQLLETQRRQLLKDLDRVRSDQKKAYGDVQELQQRLRTGAPETPKAKAKP